MMGTTEQSWPLGPASAWIPWSQDLRVDLVISRRVQANTAGMASSPTHVIGAAGATQKDINSTGFSLSGATALTIIPQTCFFQGQSQVQRNTRDAGQRCFAVLGADTIPASSPLISNGLPLSPSQASCSAPRRTGLLH